MEYRQCKKCVMDTTAKEITFGSDMGWCNFCVQASEALSDQRREKPNWSKVLDWVKRDGKKYDCVIGLSGGVDSSQALVEAVEAGLRPLCFTVDNGWNSEVADENILKLVEGLKVPLEKVVLDNEFKKIQASFLKAGLINLEIPTDHVLMAVAYDMAKRHKVKWIISGGNIETESIMPASWSYTARDLVHIKDVYGKKIEKIPTCSLLKYNYYKWIKRIKTLYILDYTGYNRKRAIETLSEHFDYKGYGEKHHESVYTQWYQNFYLYEKYGIDKRKPHLSSMINSGQITKKQALEELEKNPVYPQLGIEAKALSYKKHEHNEYKTDEKLWKFLVILIRLLRKPYRKYIKTGNNSVV